MIVLGLGRPMTGQDEADEADEAVHSCWIAALGKSEACAVSLSLTVTLYNGYRHG